MNNKKGQAALEFLMTYGWAILAAVIAIGVLYVIIGNPANLIGDRFTMSDPFIAMGKAASTNLITLEIRNGAGDSVNITSINVNGDSCVANTSSVIMPADGTYTVLIPCTIASGSRAKGDVVVKYLSSGSSVQQTASGTLNLKVA